MHKRDKIVKEEDFNALFLLNDDADFSIGLFEILTIRYDKNPTSLNNVQLNLFLCMHLENAGQADSILSFLQEWFPDQKEQIVNLIIAIGAVKSAEIIRQAIELLPKDDSWFFESSNDATEKIMGKLDHDFSDYPDGSMNVLYRRYAEKHRCEF